ncbi:TRAP transporter substrate-binding protein [Nesterenkonia cremea]|uniref:C4-dicarboxylate ABC transporter substrate-binding protein n=1 Tax=Nesterenkonia cremea TaxID=1882340 RepID=A0A917AX26_9MICC|nr:TRAP transporter substrate-binding protein [Nesterenkonia cremea]GGE79104.1 C4-dicarboxylate ABC transporter substrate-binding protein [Nesterenkonia cremea]
MFTSRSRAAGGLAAVSLILAACSPSASADEAPVTLTLGHTWSVTDANAQAVQDFADEVAEVSDGNLRIEIYPGGQLGEDIEILEGLGLETVDIWVGGSGVYSQMSPVGQFLVLPFLFDDLEEAMTHYDGELGEAVERQVAETSNTRLLSLWPRGPRHLTLNTEATTPEDISGLRIRVPENPMSLQTWAGFDASPTPMPFGDIMTALEQGALEGQENPLETIHSAGLPTAQSHLILTAHVIEPTALSIGDAAWARLDEEQRQILEEAASGTARDELLAHVLEREEVLVDELADEGMTVIEPDRDAFAARVEDLPEMAGPEVAALYETRWAR